MTESAKKAIEEKAHEWAVNHSSAPDKETPDWIEIDFKGGAEFGYQLGYEEAMKQIVEKTANAVYIASEVAMAAGSKEPKP